MMRSACGLASPRRRWYGVAQEASTAGVAEFKGRLKRQSYHRRKTPQGELKRPGTDEGGLTAGSQLQGRLNPAAAMAEQGRGCGSCFRVVTD